jgi:site-specific recombinase XerD
MIVSFFTRPGRRGVRFLYCRLTTQQKCAEIKLNYIVTGSDRKVDAYKKQVEDQIAELYNHQLIKEKPADPQTIKTLFQTKTKAYFLLDTFKDFIDRRIKPRVDKKDLGKGSLQKYTCVYEHLKDFTNARGRTDVPWQMVDDTFVEEFDEYLRQFNSHNTVMKSLYKFKTVVTYALKVKKYITEDPFATKSLTLKKVFPIALTQTELQMLIKKRMDVERLEQVKDLFLFQCFSGLSYADMRKLKQAYISDQIINTNRQKNGEPAIAYMYQLAEMILKKHENRLPIVSNQKMNAYLKEIADICNISKRLTTHVARHTYATTVNLKNGVSLQTVQKLLGHATIKQTEHYARLDDSDVKNVCKRASRKVNKLYNLPEQLSFFDKQKQENGEEKAH